MISLLNKLGRRMVSDRGEKLNNPRLFSSTAKRVLSVLFLLILGFSFLPTFDINVSAAGLSNVKYEVLENGSLKVTATVTPSVVNGSVGLARLDAAMMTSVSDGYCNCTIATSTRRISGSDRTVSVWENIYWGWAEDTYRVRVRTYDTTTGTGIYTEHSETVTLEGITYNPDSKRLPAISNVTVTPNSSDKTKVRMTFSLWHCYDRRPYKINYYRGDANGENGTLVYSRDVNNVNFAWTYTYDYSGLTAGTTYTFWYTLSTELGDAVSPKYVATPGTPTAPANIRAIPGNGKVTFTWDEPTNKNGATIAGYNVYATTSATTPVNGSTPLTTRSYERSGTNGLDIYPNQVFLICAVTTEGKEGAKGQITGGIRVGSPQPVANACCIMLNS